MNGIRIRGTGKCVPEKVLTNDDLVRLVDTSDEWITARTGIRRRHICQGETQVSLCAQAAREAMERSEVSPGDIGVCIVATMTPDYATPSTACLLQRELGLGADTLCFDLNAACTGFVYALYTAQCLLNGSEKKFGLVVGGEALSTMVNWEDRGTCILFGDAAGAAVVECRQGWEPMPAYMGSHGNDRLLAAREHLTMEGTRVFKFAVEAIPHCIDRVLAQGGLSPEDIDHFVFHQANARIIDSVVKKKGLDPEKCHKNLEEYGNTSAASIPLLLSELEEQGRLKSGDRCLLVGFGGGLTWGAVLVEYAG